jgi:predicted nuclease of predicted toxin-antitoxin system
MRVKLDENIPVSAKHALENAFCDVHSVFDEKLSGVDDGTLWDVCQQEQRFLVTQDLDFSDIRKFSPGTHCGILLLRLKNPSATAIKALLKELVSRHQFKEWHGCVVVATQRKVRVFKPSFQHAHARNPRGPVL